MLDKTPLEETEIENLKKNARTHIAAYSSFDEVDA